MNKKLWLNRRNLGIIFVLLWTVLVITTSSDAQTCAPAPVGLVSWYAGEGSVLDSRSGINGTLQNGAGFAAGRVGQAFNFDGVDDRVDIPRNTSVFALTRGTVEMWVKVPNLDTNQIILFSIADAGVAFPASDSWSIAYRGGSDHNIQTALVAGGSVFMNASTPTNTINDSNFHHIAVVADGVGAIDIYVDGVLQILTGPVVTDSFFGQAGNADNMKIGAIERDQVFAAGEKTIDEVSIYNRALSAGEIQAIFNAGTAGKCKPTATIAPSGQVAWLAGDGNPSDISGNNNNGSLMSGVGFAVGRVGQSFSFDGVDDYVDVANTSSLDFGTGNFTIETWANFNSLAQDQSLFGKILGSFPNDQSYLLEFDAPNSLRFIVTDHASRNDLIVPTSLVTGTWYHIAAIRQGNTNLLYLNGSLIGQQTAGSNSDVGTGGTAYIGKLPVPATNLRNLSGKIDELSFYNRALTQPEITSIFNAGQAGKLKTAATPTGFADLGFGNSDLGSEKQDPQSAIQNPQSVVAAVGDVTATFQSVSAAGVTQEIPLDAALLPPLPNGFNAVGLTYDVATSAVYGGNVDLCFNLNSLLSFNFNNLRLFHLESGGWVSRTAPVNTAPNLCTTGVTSLSPFAIASFTPTAANVSVSGKIRDALGSGIARVRVSITDSSGATRSAMTNSFGSYHFDGNLSGEIYVVTAAHKKYQFSQPTQVIFVGDVLHDVDFTVLE